MSEKQAAPFRFHSKYGIIDKERGRTGNTPSCRPFKTVAEFNWINKPVNPC